MDSEEMKAHWDEIVARLKQERDELALKMHLGRKDLQAEWDRLEAQWKQIKAVKGPPMKEAAVETAEGVRAAMELAAEEIKKGYDKIRKML